MPDWYGASRRTPWRGASFCVRPGSQEDCMAKAATKSTTKKKTTAAKSRSSKKKAAEPEETTPLEGWLGAAPIQKLLEQGEKEKTLDTEEINDAFNRTTHLMQVEADELNIEDVMELITSRRITNSELIEDNLDIEDKFDTYILTYYHK